jgi:hypothetical protein
MQITPDVPMSRWRLRPRDGRPRALVEHAAQRMWRWRVELALIYLIVTITVLLLASAGVI